MNRDDLLKLLSFPKEWKAWDMYPEELATLQAADFSPGSEAGAEHYRCGAFHWWMSRNPSSLQLTALIKLSFLDPDALMGSDIRKYLLQCEAFGQEHVILIRELDKMP